MSFLNIKNAPNIKKNTLVINSQDRSSGTNSNFVYNLNTTMSNIRLIEIKNIELDYNINNINSNQDRFNWSDSTGITHDLTITHNDYNIHELSTLITNQMNTDETDSSMIYEVALNNHNKIAFNSTLGITSFDLNFGITEKSIGNLLGFDEVNLTGTTSYTSDVVNMIYTKNLFIGSTKLAENSFDGSELSNGISNLLIKVPVNSKYGDVLFYSPNKNIRNKISSLTSIDIVVRDDLNRIVELDTSDIVITLDIYNRIFNNSFSI